MTTITWSEFDALPTTRIASQVREAGSRATRASGSRAAQIDRSFVDPEVVRTRVLADLGKAA